MGTNFEAGTRPADGVCPDCGRVIRNGVWIRHREVAHGPTTRAVRPPLRATASAWSPDPPPANPARARLRTTVAAALLALVCLVVYVGDLASWSDHSASCQVVGHARRAAAVVLPRSCGFYTVVAPLQTAALVLGCAAVLVALLAPLIPDDWFRS